MCLLLETVRIMENKLQNLAFHNDRINHTRKILFKKSDKWDLSEIIRIPELKKNLIYKCRILYSETIHSIEFQRYSPPVIKKLYLIHADELEYSFKYADRTALDTLKRKLTDPFGEILIIKKGFVSDTSFSNIVFFNGRDWVTPDTPLLRGTKREEYLTGGIIHEDTIREQDIRKFEKACLINAMLDLEDSVEIQSKDIVFPNA
jgi:4-amino-4-deoxychorismate lyase